MCVNTRHINATRGTPLGVFKEGGGLVDWVSPDLSISCLYCPLTVVDVASGEGRFQGVFVPLHWCSSVTVNCRLFSIQCDVKCIHNWMIFLLCKPSSGCLANLKKMIGKLFSFLTGKLLLHKSALGSSTKSSEDVFGVQNASLNMLWELFIQFGKPCLCLVGSSRESSPVDEEERTRKKRKKNG